MKQALCLVLVVCGLASVGRAQDPEAESVPGSVLAHENVGDLLPHLGKEPLLGAVGAAGQAFALVNPILEQRGQKPLYCPPPQAPDRAGRIRLDPRADPAEEPRSARPARDRMDQRAARRADPGLSLSTAFSEELKKSVTEIEKLERKIAKKPKKEKCIPPFMRRKQLWKKEISKRETTFKMKSAELKKVVEC